jgi:dTDP-4-amino-4,6-dideoxygalactose transaminase
MHSDSVTAALAAAAADGSWGKYHGPNTEQLRSDLIVWSGCKNIELCASGTAASELALRAFKVGQGDEVILAAYDYAASFKNVLMLGAVPVLVDVTPEDFSIRVDQVRDAITAKTKAIVVSHLHGGVADMLAIMDIAKKHGISVLEDACQATGATLNGKRLGSLGTLGIISFGGSKLITAGRGGAILGNDEQLFQRMHLHSFRGNTAYPLSELQAAVLVPQLAELEERNQHRAARVRELSSVITNYAGLHCVPIRPQAEPAWYKVGLRLDTSRTAVSRDDFAATARTGGVACDRSLHALHTVHSKRRFRAFSDLPGADEANDHGLQLHHPILLGTSDDMHRVAAVFQSALSK